MQTLPPVQAVFPGGDGSQVAGQEPLLVVLLADGTPLAGKTAGGLCTTVVQRVVCSVVRMLIVEVFSAGTVLSARLEVRLRRPNGSNRLLGPGMMGDGPGEAAPGTVGTAMLGPTTPGPMILVPRLFGTTFGTVEAAFRTVETAFSTVSPPKGATGATAGAVSPLTGAEGLRTGDVNPATGAIGLPTGAVNPATGATEPPFAMDTTLVLHLVGHFLPWQKPGQLLWLAEAVAKLGKTANDWASVPADDEAPWGDAVGKEDPEAEVEAEDEVVDEELEDEVVDEELEDEVEDDELGDEVRCEELASEEDPEDELCSEETKDERALELVEAVPEALDDAIGRSKGSNELDAAPAPAVVRARDT